MYENDPMLYFDVKLNEIPIEDSGKEVTVNFKVLEIENKGVFYTDANGLKMVKREVRELGNPIADISGNYYPVTSAITIRDEKEHL